MALDEKKPCIWHAFNALAAQGKGSGVKTQLKVLTQNIGSSLSLPHIEDGLEDFLHSGGALDFTEYMHYLDMVLFSELSTSEELRRADLSVVDEICWLVCQKAYLQRTGAHVLSADHLYKLWRVYNLFVETAADQLVCPVVADGSEVDIVLTRLHGLMGRAYDAASLKEAAAAPGGGKFSYLAFISLLETHYCGNVHTDILSMAINQLYEDCVNQTIKKGYMTKKGHIMSNWKERWFVLTPRQLKYYTNNDESDLKGTVLITKTCKMEPIAEKIGAKSNRFHLVTEQKTYEISVSSALVRTEWAAAFGRAKEECEDMEKLLMKSSRRRRLVRQESAAAVDREAQSKRIEEELQTRTNELLAEKQARAEAEAELQAESERRRAEQERLRQLEDVRVQLEKLLADERQAKRDEEIVRQLQSRILEEEFAKREHLEQLRAELESSLAEERQLREELEQLLRTHEELLEEDEERLEDGRQQVDQHRREMEEAKAKLQEAEKVKEELLQKLHEKEIVKMKIDPLKFASHRGLGAFTENEFKVKRDKIMRATKENAADGESSVDKEKHTDDQTEDEIPDKDVVDGSSESNDNNNTIDAIAEGSSGDRVVELVNESGDAAFRKDAGREVDLPESEDTNLCKTEEETKTVSVN